MKTITTREIVSTALMCAIISVLAPLAIPLAGGVPVSMATFAVMLAGAICGPKWGTLSTLLYVIIGAVGLPVYANYASGFGNLVGPTGGYLIGYIPLAFCVGYGYWKFGKEKTGVQKIAALVISILIGEVILYILGTVWFMYIGQTPLMSALVWCVIPFIPGDIAKIVAVSILVPILERTLPKKYA